MAKFLLIYFNINNSKKHFTYKRQYEGVEKLCFKS